MTKKKARKPGVTDKQRLDWLLKHWPVSLRSMIGHVIGKTPAQIPSIRAAIDAAMKAEAAK